MILVIDDMAIFREPIAACLRLAGFEAVCAADGAEGLTKARERKPELILLDMAMPRMDGLGVLRALQNDPELCHVPVIALTAVSDKDVILRAKGLKVREYLLKSRFRSAELVERIRRHLSAATSGRVEESEITAGRPEGEEPADGPAVTEVPPLSQEECVRRSRAAISGSTLAGVVAQVLTLTSSPRGDMAQLAELIGRDPMLSAGVLTVANSAAYASARAVMATIPDAVRHIGCSAVRDIATGLGVFEAMPRTGPDGFNPIRCWQHSFAVAQLCERLAEGLGEEKASLAYVVGLCHDLPQIVFRTQFADEYRAVLARQAASPSAAAEEIERAVLGLTRRQVLLTIVRSLGLPDTIRARIEAFYEDGREQLGDVLRLAEHYANGLQLASGLDAAVTAFTPQECRRATGIDHPSTPDGQQFRSQVLGLTGALARLTREEERQLMAPVHPQRRVRLYLARDPALSRFDPVEAGLRSMAEVFAADSLPGADESGRYDGLVVLTRRSLAPAMTYPDIARCNGSKPLLWLTLQDEGPVDQAPQRPLVLPVGIDRVAGFIAGVEENKAVGQAARVA